MRGERPLLRVGEYLISRACQQLPAEVREERYREWAAELPAILGDPQIRLAPWRAARMLAYAADTLRGAALTPGRTRRWTPGRTLTLVNLLLLLSDLVWLAWGIWSTAQAPGQIDNYANLALILLSMAVPVSWLAHCSLRTSALVTIPVILAVEVMFLWNAVLAPGDWVNYFMAVLVFLGLLAILGLLWWLDRYVPPHGRHWRA